MNMRLARLAAQMKQEVSEILRTELRDPRLGFITITDAEVSADLRHARVYYTVLGSQEQMEQTAEALASAAGFVRGEFGHRVRLKFTPEITFHFDPSVQHAARIEELLNRVMGSAPPCEVEPDA